MLLLLSGCRHKVSDIHVIVAVMPSISVPPPTHHSDPLPPLETESSPSLTMQLVYRRLPRFRPHPETAKQLAQLQPAASPYVVLGNLTTGYEASDPELRQETSKLLRTQQQRLQTLSHAYAAQHSQEVEQARLFVHQALDALHKLDLDGARILATKAKVLLDEL